MIRLTRRQLATCRKFKDYKEDNSFVMIGYKDSSGIDEIGIRSLSMPMSEVFTSDDKGAIVKGLIPLLESNHDILIQDYQTVPILKDLLKEVGAYGHDEAEISSGYIDGLVKDVRYDLYPFMHEGKDGDVHLSWSARDLRFTNDIFSSPNVEYGCIDFAGVVDQLSEFPEAEVEPVKESVYISGPITNNAKYEDEFEEADFKLSEIGLNVINPVKLASKLQKHLFTEKELWRVAMDIDLHALTRAADFMALIPDKGIASRGVAIEKSVASSFGITTHKIDNLISLFRETDKETTRNTQNTRRNR